MKLTIEGRPYDTFSERYPAFLEKFPITEYPLIVQPVPLAEVAPSLHLAYEQALKTGERPPPYVAFRAQLFNLEGKLLASATSLTEIASFKDWEKGETAARQRLIQACGFGSGMFDRDETQALKDRGIPFTVQGVAPAPAAAANTTAQAEAMAEAVSLARPVIVPEADGNQPAAAAAAQPSAAASTAPAATEGGQAVLPLAALPVDAPAPAPKSQPAPLAATVADPDETPPHRTVVAQIRNLSKSRGVEFVEPKTRTEAQLMLSLLLGRAGRKGAPPPRAQAAPNGATLQ